VSAPSGGLPELIAASGLDATERGGSPATSTEYLVEVERTVALYAATLAQLHAVQPTGELPVHDAAHLVAEARAAVSEGRVTEGTLTPAYRHMSPERLLEVLVERAAHDAVASGGPLVLTHGRPLLDRLRCDAGASLGLTGWERAGLGDPYRDLAVAAREVGTRLSSMLVPALFDAYAAESGRPELQRPDPVRLDWYVLAAELTP